MKSANEFVLALVTAPNVKTARALAKAVLQARLAACANLIPAVESHYWWRGKLDSASELLVLFKTSKSKLTALERCILDHHPYDTPEFLVVRLEKGNERYLAWLAESLG